MPEALNLPYISVGVIVLKFPRTIGDHTMACRKCFRKMYTYLQILTNKLNTFVS